MATLFRNKFGPPECGALKSNTGGKRRKEGQCDGCPVWRASDEKDQNIFIKPIPLAWRMAWQNPYSMFTITEILQANIYILVFSVMTPHKLAGPG
jgi:hypothetical protein